MSKTNCEKKLGMLLKKIWQTQSTDQKHESDRLMHAHNEENVTTVKELVALLRQEGQKPKTNTSFNKPDIKRNKSYTV